METAYLLRPVLLGALGLVGLLGPAAAASADPPALTVFFTSGAPTSARSPDTARPAATTRPTPSPPEAPAAACPEAVTLVRTMGDGREEMSEPLLDCDRHPRDHARLMLSLLARPRDLPRPDEAALEAFDRGTSPDRLVDGVYLFHPELLDRLQRLSDAFEGRPIEILSGYRPTAAADSRHRHGRALDLRVRGIARARVRDVLVSFDHSGVGWYPNSIFVHLDVRERTTYWVDESGPGEPARYVRGARPPAPQNTPAPNAAPPPRPDPSGTEPTASEARSIRDETAAALSQIHIDPIDPR